jgi:lantibiotic biosynthesis protein
MTPEIYCETKPPSMTNSVSTTTNWRPLLSDEVGRCAMASVREVAERLQVMHGGGADHLHKIKAGREASLARGPAGLALLFAYLDRAIPECGYAETAAHYLEQAIHLLATVPMRPSLYEGFTGISWAMTHLRDQLLDCDEDPNETIDDALLELLQVSPWTGEYDLMEGLVGLGVYGLERLPNPKAIECVERVIAHLGATATETEQGVAWFSQPGWSPPVDEDFPHGHFDTGVAHGQAGIIAFLGRACAADVNAGKARKLLDQAIAWLVAQNTGGDGYVFPDYVSSEKQKGRTRPDWCYGDLGIAAALISAAQNVNEPSWEREAVELASRVAERSPEQSVVEDGLCHGRAGAGHIFNRLYQATNEPQFERAATVRFERLLALRRPDEGIGGFTNFGHEGVEVFLDTGLYRGAAGIGLALLAASTHIEPHWDRMMLLPASGTGRSLVSVRPQ